MSTDHYKKSLILGVAGLYAILAYTGLAPRHLDDLGYDMQRGFYSQAWHFGHCVDGWMYSAGTAGQTDRFVMVLRPGTYRVRFWEGTKQDKPYRNDALFLVSLDSIVFPQVVPSPSEVSFEVLHVEHLSWDVEHDGRSCGSYYDPTDPSH